MHNLEWAAFVRASRKKLGYNLRKLAFLSGIDSSYVTLIERDGYVPRRDKVIAIARALEVDTDRALLEAGYAPEGIPISTILGKSRLDTAQDALVPELSKCLHELIALTSAQQRKAAEFLNSFIFTLRYREREKQQFMRISRRRVREA